MNQGSTLCGAVLIFFTTCKPVFMISKRISFLAFSLFLLVAVVSCSGPDNKTTDVNGMKIPNILPEDTVKGTRAEQFTIRTTFEKAIAELKGNAENAQPLLDLASAYILEGRISGNSGYYSNAVLEVVDQILNGDNATQDQKFQAYSLKSTVLLNMHQFADALQAAKQGLAMSQYNSGIWGAAVDAHTELGHYAEAVEDCDKMLALRPDLRSYSRASYLRQIHGQNAAAIAAMQMAVESGVPSLESTEWARVQLGDLYFYQGKKDSARLMYMYSLVYRPDYPYAQMGIARVCRAEGKLDSALYYNRAAIKGLSESAFISYMADLYELKGDAAKAKEVREDVKNSLVDFAKNEAKNARVKHNGNRELAQAYLALGDYDKALEYANNDLKMRPDNIDANELVAWIYYKKGDANNAKAHAEKMFITHQKNAMSLYRAGIIYSAAGDNAKGDSLKNEASGIMPYVSKMIIAGK
jgi:tetratricopeptide (TPR) repeat protein